MAATFHIETTHDATSYIHRRSILLHFKDTKLASSSHLSSIETLNPICSNIHILPNQITPNSADCGTLASATVYELELIGFA